MNKLPSKIKKIMINRIRTITLTVLLLLGTVFAENSVLLKKDMQKITSSTLKWVTVTDGSIADDAVVGSMEYVPIGTNENDLFQLNLTNRSHVKQNKIFVCRARVNGNWVPGALFEYIPICIVSLVKVSEQHHYEVLQNVDQAARLIWKDWERSIGIPDLAISAGEYFIAHAVNPNLEIKSKELAIGMTHLMGKVDPHEGVFGKLSVVDERKNVINDVDSGQILVEIEPILYELTITRLTTAREKIINRTPLKLGDITLRNDLPNQMKVESVISYQWKYSSSWGQGRAMLKALPTTIYFHNNTNVEKIYWGISYESTITDMQNIEAELEAGTGVYVTLQGTLFEVETPYNAALLTVFNDSTTMNRTIHGTWLHTVLADIEPVFGPMYYLHNNSLVPTTTTTTTTTTETPSTTTMQTITIKEATEIAKTSPNEDQNKNAVPPSPKEDDRSNTIDDDSGAMQLKKKNESDKANSGNVIFVSYSSLLLSALIMIFGNVINTIT